MKYGFMSSSRARWWHGFISQDLYFSLPALSEGFETAAVRFAERDTAKANDVVERVPPRDRNQLTFDLLRGEFSLRV